jgi:hypothetical protein
VGVLRRTNGWAIVNHGHACRAEKNQRHSSPDNFLFMRHRRISGYANSGRKRCRARCCDRASVSNFCSAVVLRPPATMNSGSGLSSSKMACALCNSRADVASYKSMQGYGARHGAAGHTTPAAPTHSASTTGGVLRSQTATDRRSTDRCSGSRKVIGGLFEDSEVVYRLKHPHRQFPGAYRQR